MESEKCINNLKYKQSLENIVYNENKEIHSPTTSDTRNKSPIRFKQSTNFKLINKRKEKCNLKDDKMIEINSEIRFQSISSSLESLKIIKKREFISNFKESRVQIKPDAEKRNQSLIKEKTDDIEEIENIPNEQVIDSLKESEPNLQKLIFKEDKHEKFLECSFQLLSERNNSQEKDNIMKFTLESLENYFGLKILFGRAIEGNIRTLCLYNEEKFKENTYLHNEGNKYNQVFEAVIDKVYSKNDRFYKAFVKGKEEFFMFSASSLDLIT